MSVMNLRITIPYTAHLQNNFRICEGSFSWFYALGIYSIYTIHEESKIHWDIYIYF